MFTEDLGGYDVARSLCTVKITRRNEEGWKPLNQVHLEGQEEEEREEREMGAYDMRMQQQFGWLAGYGQ